MAPCQRRSSRILRFLLAFSFLTPSFVEVNVSAAAGGRRTCVHLLLSQARLSKHAAGDEAEAPGAGTWPPFQEAARKDGDF